MRLMLRLTRLYSIGDVIRSSQHSWSKVFTKDEFEVEPDEDDIPLGQLACLYAYGAPNKMALVNYFSAWIFYQYLAIFFLSCSTFARILSA